MLLPGPGDTGCVLGMGWRAGLHGEGAGRAETSCLLGPVLSTVLCNPIRDVTHHSPDSGRLKVWAFPELDGEDYRLDY